MDGASRLTPRSAELTRARQRLGTRCRPTILPDEVAWPDPGVGILRARQALAELLVRFGLPADRARVEEESEENAEEPGWTDERVVLQVGMDERPFVLWEISLYVARQVSADLETADDELMVRAVALGLGPLFGGALRTRSAARGFVGGAPLDDHDLGVLIAEQLAHEGAPRSRFVAVLDHLRPDVRRGLEEAHAVMEGAPAIDGVPTPLRRTWLEARFHELSASLASPPRWLTPTARDFPDRFRGDLPSVRKIASRLLRHAGLADRKVIVEPFDERTDALAWFESIDDTQVRFGVRRDITSDGPYLVSSMAHEVAHAFRRAHRLEVLDADLEEELTDLTCVALGFGLLMAATTERQTRLSAGSARWTAHASVGYLEVEDFAWLLAVAGNAQGLAEGAFRAAVGHLDARPRDAVIACRRTLAGKPPPSPLAFLLAVLLGTVLLVLGVGALTWARTRPPGASCRGDHDCRALLGHACVAERCVVPCARDSDCDRDEHCGTPRASGRYCLPD